VSVAALPNWVFPGTYKSVSVAKPLHNIPVEAVTRAKEDVFAAIFPVKVNELSNLGFVAVPINTVPA